MSVSGGATSCASRCKPSLVSAQPCCANSASDGSDGSDSVMAHSIPYPVPLVVAPLRVCGEPPYAARTTTHSDCPRNAAIICTNLWHASARLCTSVGAATHAIHALPKSAYHALQCATHAISIRYTGCMATPTPPAFEPPRYPRGTMHLPALTILLVQQRTRQQLTLATVTHET